MVSIPSQADRRVTGHIPQMSETRYERLSAGMLAVGLTLAVTCLWLAALWYSRWMPESVRRQSPESGPLQRGVEMALPSTEVRVPESVEEEVSPEDAQNLQQLLENVTALQGPLPLPSLEARGPSADSDDQFGGSRFAEGGTGVVGVPNGPSAVGTHAAQRWRIEYPATDLSTYARALSQFGIEPACVFADGRIVYLTGLAGQPQTRVGRVGKQETRLFMLWGQNSPRAQGDRELFRQAGFTDFASARLVHFFPAETESLLQTLELEYQQRTPAEIRRTEFRLHQTRSAGEFVVVRQLLK